MSKKESVLQFTGLKNKTAYMVIFVFAILLYSNTFHHGFVLDDTAVIENNKFVKEGIKGIPQIFTTFYWKGYWNSNAGLYRPLSLIMFAIEYQLSPENPVLHHFINILLYALVCCLLFRALTKLFDKINPLFFLFSVLFFVAHPIHTDVVANIKSRDEILSLLFFLLCCDYLYFKMEEKKIKTILISSVFFLLSLLSKEGALIFLPLILLFDYIKEKNIIKLVKNRLNLVVTTFVWLAWHQYVILSSGLPVIQYTRGDNSLVAATFMEQKATALGMFFRYIVKAFYPYQLSYDYSFNQIEIIKIFSPLAVLGIILLIALLFIAIKYFKRDPLISISIAFILLPLFFTGNIFFNIGATMADRFLFVSTIGSSLLFTFIIFKLLKIDFTKNFPVNKAAYIFVPVLLLFSIKTFSRNKDWKDNATLFAHDVVTVPNSARAHYNYGTALMDGLYKKENNENDAQKEFETCLKIDPLYLDALINQGVLYLRQKEYPMAIQSYQKALAINRNDNELCANAGEAFYKNNQTDSAIFYLEKAHRLGNNIVGSYNLLGSALFSKKEYAEACKAFEQGVKADSTSWNLYLNYGNALAISNRDQEAIKAFQKSYELNSGNVQTLYFLALTYKKIGDNVNADKFYNEYQKANK
ncbi:MAG: tetratricopeptide repeat protein [Bacteroidia bacterium]